AFGQVEITAAESGYSNPSRGEGSQKPKAITCFSNYFHGVATIFEMDSISIISIGGSTASLIENIATFIADYPFRSIARLGNTAGFKINHKVSGFPMRRCLKSTTRGIIERLCIRAAIYFCNHRREGMTITGNGFKSCQGRQGNYS